WRYCGPNWTRILENQRATRRLLHCGGLSHGPNRFPSCGISVASDCKYNRSQHFARAKIRYFRLSRYNFLQELVMAKANLASMSVDALLKLRDTIGSVLGQRADELK